MTEVPEFDAERAIWVPVGLKEHVDEVQHAGVREPQSKNVVSLLPTSQFPASVSVSKCREEPCNRTGLEPVGATLVKTAAGDNTRSKTTVRALARTCKRKVVNGRPVLSGNKCNCGRRSHCLEGLHAVGDTNTTIAEIESCHTCCQLARTESKMGSAPDDHDAPFLFMALASAGRMMVQRQSDKVVAGRQCAVRELKSGLHAAIKL